MDKCRCVLYKVAKLLVIVGGLNWGLVGASMMFSSTSWNLVHMIFGSWPMVEGLVYLLVGISALVMIFGCKCAKCKTCMAGVAPASAPKM